MKYLNSAVGLTLVLFASFAFIACSDKYEVFLSPISQPQFNMATLEFNAGNPYKMNPDNDSFKVL